MKYLGIAVIGLLIGSLTSGGLLVEAKPEMCTQPHSKDGMAQDGAACMAFMPAWTYDAKKNACSEFVFGGCGGNANQFSSQVECEKACKD
ncbi:male accessory gland serine protease inhibitor [Drosophila pseudoobscura]|uniref:Male accessory gland serine protease inhibitor n=1 Tax=Drosophila pseudoobscura pseudoobscura TaxID=46245 RepID=Q29ME1_DROPS|nr:male accessory gland serine protease inhibitor [Drosophila pseudoobscura]